MGLQSTWWFHCPWSGSFIKFCGSESAYEQCGGKNRIHLSDFSLDSERGMLWWRSRWIMALANSCMLPQDTLNAKIVQLIFFCNSTFRNVTLKNILKNENFSKYSYPKMDIKMSLLAVFSLFRLMWTGASFDSQSLYEIKLLRNWLHQSLSPKVYNKMCIIWDYNPKRVKMHFWGLFPHFFMQFPSFSLNFISP